MSMRTTAWILAALLAGAAPAVCFGVEHLSHSHDGTPERGGCCLEKPDEARTAEPESPAFVEGSAVAVLKAPPTSTPALPRAAAGLPLYLRNSVLLI